LLTESFEKSAEQGKSRRKKMTSRVDPVNIAGHHVGVGRIALILKVSKVP